MHHDSARLTRGKPKSLAAYMAATGIIWQTNAPRLLSLSVKEVMEHADFLWNSSTSMDSASSCFKARQLAALLRKIPLGSDENPYDPRGTALRTFLDVERRMRHVNKAVRLLDMAKPLRRRGIWVTTLEAMSRDIAYILGEEPNLVKIYSKCGFGPGAAVGFRSSGVNVFVKTNASKWTGTASVIGHFADAVLRDYHMARLVAERVPGGDGIAARLHRTVKVVNHNNIAFVQKTAKTHRVIAVEPLLNTYIQKGIDVELRMKLRRIGIDLEMGQQINAELARQGSLHWEDDDPYVTLDLSSASDSLATEVVRRVLPPAWFELLNSARCKSYRLDDSVHKAEKFVSMGNGFCFPLETLIFASICRISGAKSGDYHVFGDDIIVRRSVADRVISHLHLLGFRLNRTKSYLDGPFRESCGSNFFQGVDVNVHTQDVIPFREEEWMTFLNGTLRNDLTKSFFEDFRTAYFSSLKPHRRFFRPHKGPADTAYEVPFDLFLTSPYARFNRDLWTWSWKERVPTPLVTRGEELEEWPESHVYCIFASPGMSARGGVLQLPRRGKTRTRTRRRV